MRRNWDIIKSMNASYSFVQKTTRNTHGQNSMRKSLHQQGYDVNFGKATSFKFSGQQKIISTWNARSGGLAAIAKRPHRIHPIAGTSPPFENGRCMHSWIPTYVGNRGFHVFNIDGHVGAGPRNQRAFTLNEKLLSDVLISAAALGDVPWLILGDYQTSPDDSPALGAPMTEPFSRNPPRIFRKRRMRTSVLVLT